MSLTLTADELAALEAPHVDLIWFVELQFDGGTKYLHTGVGTYTTLSHDWLGIGDLGSISPIEEAEGFSPYELTLELSGVAEDLLAESLNESVFERRAKIYLGILNPSDGVTLLAEPKQRFAGSMQNISVVSGKQNTLLLSVESEFKYFQDANGSRWTDEQQQSEFSGDLALQYVSQLQDASVQWGPGAPASRVGSPDLGEFWSGYYS